MAATDRAFAWANLIPRALAGSPVELAPRERVSAAPPQSAPDPARLHELDGLRGWASVSVMLYHIFWETFGAVEPAFRNIATGFLFHGRLAVAVFFVLSGEALSAGYFAGKGTRAVVALAVKRYFRLTIPILASCLIVYALLALGLTANRTAGIVVHREEWLGSFLKTNADFGAMLKFAMFDVYDRFDGEQAYNPLLWTMRIELTGSMLVFLLLFLEPYLTRPTATFGAVAIGLLAANSYLACFLVGMIYAQARQDGTFARLRAGEWPARISWLTLPGIAAADGALQLRGLPFDSPEPIIVSVLLLGLVFVNRPMSAFFASAPSRLLGRLSFPLYLTQFAVMVSFTSWLIVRAGAAGPLKHGAIWGIALLSVVACLAVAALFDPVEQGTKRALSEIAKRLLK